MQFMTLNSLAGMLWAALDRGRRMNSGPLLVLCACPDSKSATAIATAVLDSRLAACVNRIAVIESLYRWEGRIQRDQEVLLLIKTTADRFDALEQRIAELHPYELPEIIGVPVTLGSAAYLDWLTESTH